MADRYPREVEFYVPQLCTYLFHFGTGDGSIGPGSDSFNMLEAPNPEGPGTPTEETKSSKQTDEEDDEQTTRSLLKEFLLERSHKSNQFAHKVFWYIVAAIDDSESIQMS